MSTRGEDRGYVDLTAETAPDAARPLLASTRAKLGFVPSALARMALAPALPRAFRQAVAAFEKTTLDPLERESVVLTIARDVGCEVCVAMHARALRELGAGSVADAIVATLPIDDPKLSALVELTSSIVAERGDVGAEPWRRFLDAGYTRAQALELVIGVGAYTMSTYANRLTAAGVDPALR
jgi:AhpD family alkylhydroperoxidase